MTRVIAKFVSFFLFLCNVLCDSTIFFVHPLAYRGNNATGTFLDPFDNLLLAINVARNYESSTIYLQYGWGAPHYVFFKELDHNYYAFSKDIRDYEWFKHTIRAGNTLVEMGNITVKPYYCNQVANIAYANEYYCTQTNRITISIKSDDLSFWVRGKVTFEDVIIDGLEAIKIWNPSNTNISDCLNRRSACCIEKDFPEKIYTFQCAPNYLDYSGIATDPQSSLFFLDSPKGQLSNRVSLTFNNTEIKNFIIPQIKSFIQTSGDMFDLVFWKCQIAKVFFDRGLIYHANDSLVSNSSFITIQKSRFINYNPFNLRNSNSSRREGYFLYSENKFSGIIQVLSTTFQNFTTSVRSECWIQTQDYYNAPMNNRILDEPRSRSDLWNQYDKDHRFNRGLMSSLIYLQFIDGAITIQESTFQNIIGTSGSVLHVDEALNSRNWFTIYDSIFDNNFAYDGFANILISKSSNASLSNMFACPHIEIVNSKFTNAYGCPGSYGNIALICYWDSIPPDKTSLSDYSFGSSVLSDFNTSSDAKTDLAPFLGAEEDKFAYIRVKNSVFEYNQLSLSNSLAVVGSYFTILENNIFQHNTGTNFETFHYRFLSSNFYSRHSEQFPSDFENHFGQATAVYFDRVFKIYSRGNTFNNNYGPWEGSIALAYSITIKNWVKIAKSIKFENDIFANHNGASIDIKVVTRKLYLAPIVAISYDEEGSNNIFELTEGVLNSFGRDVNIVMDGVKFNKNSANYDCDVPDLGELNEIIKLIINSQDKYNSGFVKLLFTFEAEDIITNTLTNNNPTELGTKASFTFRKGEITDNILHSDACLFTTSWAESYILDQVRISNNSIYAEAAALPESFSSNQPQISSILTSHHGLFCLSALESLASVTSTQITANELIVFNNKGIMFNFYPENSAQFYLANSIFYNNTCSHSSMISVYNNGSMTSINNKFISNNNALGNIFATTNSSFVSLFGTYLKNNGTHASLLYLNDERERPSYEMVAKIFWNDVNPKYKLFKKALLPQGSLYFIDSSVLELHIVDFYQNFVYSGLVNCFACTSIFTSSTIHDSQISGTSIIGNFVFLGSLTLKNTKISNFSINRNSDIPVQQSAAVVLLGSQLTIDNVEFEDGVIGTDASLLSGNTIDGSIKNLNLTRIQQRQEGNDGLIKFTFSNLNIESLICRSTTSILAFASSTVNITSMLIDDLKLSSNKKFIIDMVDTTLDINRMKYQANRETGNLLSLITGDKDFIKIVNSAFLDIPDGQDKLFNLKNSNYTIIMETTFFYTEDANQPTVLDLAEFKLAIIRRCTFKMGGKALRVSKAHGPLTFAGNIILSSSNFEKLVIEDSKDVALITNIFIRLGDPFDNSLIESSIRIADAEGMIYLFHNKFLSLNGLNGVLEISASTCPYNVNISHSIFIGNKGASGGALYLSVDKYWTNGTLPYAHIQDSVFLQNKAINHKDIDGRGGAIYQTSPSQTKQVTVLKRNSFFSNSADKIGGAIYFDYAPLQVRADSKFKENYATRLNHFASYPVRIVEFDPANPINKTYVPDDKPLAFTQTKSVYNWTNIASGQISDQVFYFAVLDMYDQVCYDDENSILELYPEGLNGTLRYTFSNLVSVKASSGLYIFNRFKFTYRVGGTFKLTFESSAVNAFKELPVNSLVFISKVEVTTSFRLCSLGEFASKDDYNLTTCQRCQPSLWQLKPNNTELSCKPCDEETTICQGGNDVGPKPGYWRLNETADIMVKCRIREACLGNQIAGDAVNPDLDLNGQCAEGYSGNACFSCQPGWGKSSSGKCGKCSEEIWRYFVFFFSKMIAMLIIFHQIRSTILLGKVFKNNSVRTEMAVLMRILSNYFQLVSGISVINISWPSSMSESLANASPIANAQDQTLAIECFVYRDQYGANNYTIFWKIFIANITPLVLVILGAMFWAYRCFIKEKRQFKDFINKIVTTTIIICYNMQPETITQTFKLFQCKNLYRTDAPELYMTENYDIKCWEGYHIKWALGLGIPSIIIWIFVFPLVSISILWRNREKLESEKISRKYAFLYVGYKQDKYYWEFLIIIRKILLIFSAIIGNLHSISLQIYLSVIFTISAYVLHAHHNPYSEAHYNRLETISLLSSEIVSLYGLYFQVIKREESLDIILGLLSVAGIVSFFVLFLRYFCKTLIIGVFRNKLTTKIFTWIGKKLCCCINFKPIFDRLGFNTLMELSRLPTYNKQVPRLSTLTRESIIARKDILVETPKNSSEVLSPKSSPSSLEPHKINQPIKEVLSLDNVPEEREAVFAVKAQIFATFSRCNSEEQNTELKIQDKKGNLEKNQDHIDEKCSPESSWNLSKEKDMNFSFRIKDKDQEPNSPRVENNDNMSTSRMRLIASGSSSSRFSFIKKENMD